MTQYKMTKSDKELFLSGDEGRGMVRKEASELHSDAESIQIVDEDGNLFDTVTGTDHESETTEPGFAIVLTDEQLEERRTIQALEAADLSRIEEELRPQVMAKLKDEARTELREEYAETIRNLRREKTELKAQVIRLTEGVGALSRRESELKTELTVLKASKTEATTEEDGERT
jgi:hypothetical protein